MGMDAPTISIKIKGLGAEAIRNQLLAGGIKIKGANALMMGANMMGGEGNRAMMANMMGGDGNRAMMMMGGDGNRAMMAKKGLLMREVELEGNRMMMQQAPNNLGAGIGKGSMANMNMANMTTGGTKAVVGSGVTKTVGATGAMGATGAKASGLGTAAMYYPSKGLAWTLWLGGLGPWLVLGSLGLAATGLYFYFRAQRMMLEGRSEEFDDR